MKRDTQLVGAAGEHLVLSRLLNHQYLAAQAPPGAAKVDILVNHLADKPPRLIQVKTITGKNINNGWHMSEKHEKIVDPNIFYCFVALGDKESDVYVIPSEIVATVVTDEMIKWLATPGAKGQQRNYTKMRRIQNQYKDKFESAPDGWMEKYLENWEQLI